MHTTNDYVMFSGSDDEFFNDACEVLYGEITSEDIDIVGDFKQLMIIFLILCCGNLF